MAIFTKGAFIVSGDADRSEDKRRPGNGISQHELTNLADSFLHDGGQSFFARVLQGPSRASAASDRGADDGFDAEPMPPGMGTARAGRRAAVFRKMPAPTNAKKRPAGKQFLAEIIRQMCVAAKIEPNGEPPRRRNCVFMQSTGRVARELLYSEVMASLTTFWRAAGHPEWPRTQSTVWRSICRGIVSNAEEAKDLTSEVQCVLMLRKLVEQPQLPGETAEDRRERLKEFFEHYYARDLHLAVERSSDSWRARHVGGVTAAIPRPEAYEPPVLLPPIILKTSPKASPPAGTNLVRGTNPLRVTGPPPPKASPVSGRGAKESGSLRRTKELSKKLVATQGQMLLRRPFTTDLQFHREQDPEDLVPIWAVSSDAGPMRERPCTSGFPVPKGVTKPRTSPMAACTPTSSVMASSGRLSAGPSFAGASSSSLVSFPDPLAGGLSLISDWEDPLESSSWALPLLPPEGGGPTLGQSGAQNTYLQACQKFGVAPLITPFVTGHSTSLLLSGHVLEDRHMLPITAMTSRLEAVEEIDLADNARLTEKSLVPLFRALSDGSKGAESIVRLSLSGCVHIGQGTVAVIVSLLGTQPGGLRGLQELNLGGVKLHMTSFVSLASAIGRHAMLKNVVLTDTGLGQGTPAQTCRIISELTKAPTLEALDLGWSRLTGPTFAHLGSSLASANCLHTLSVPNCSATSTSGRDFPVEYFLERLSHVSTLTRLDVSLNNIDWRGALVLEDALEQHSGFRDIQISDNALGVTGLRSLLRLLARDTSGVVKLQIDSCAKGGIEGGEADADANQAFNVTNPAGRYSLDLSRPYHRALLRMLHKTCERFSCKSQAAFQDISFQSGSVSYSHAKKDEHGVWVVPKQGQLSLTFGTNAGKLKSNSVEECDDMWDFSGFLQKRISLMRLQPSSHKVAPLFAHWKALGGRNAEQVALLDALAMDFTFSFPQLRELAREKELTNDVIGRMMHCISGGPVARYLSMLLAPTLRSYEQNYESARRFLAFNAQSPSGHYKLDLGKPSDYAVAEQLLLLDRWECEIDESLKRPDTSQWGLRSHFRNLQHQGRQLQRVRMTEWRLPIFDTLDFDYVSGRRSVESSSDQALDDRAFKKILKNLRETEVEATAKIDVLRSVGHWFLLRSMQMRDLLGVCDSEAWRGDVVALFYFQIVDMQNEKVFRLRFGGTGELDKIRERLGWATSFPFIQPERASFRLDLQYYDCRLAMTFFIMLMNREGVTNVKHALLVDENGQDDPLMLGILRAWDAVEKLPMGGTFCATYVCAPEDRQLALRRSLYEKYGMWKMFPDAEVVWWAGVEETPPVVLSFMDWLAREFSEGKDTFSIFAHGDRVTLGNFEDTLREMKSDFCKGADGASRVLAVFRFLDASNKGGVTKSQWKILDQLRQDVELSMREFTVFLYHKFGPGATFLDKAWAGFEGLKDDEVPESSWRACVIDKWQYFGPAVGIHVLLDRTRSGSVSHQEFMRLNSFVEY